MILTHSVEREVWQNAITMYTKSCTVLLANQVNPKIKVPAIAVTPANTAAVIHFELHRVPSAGGGIWLVF
jgi:hypothetical protein